MLFCYNALLLFLNTLKHFLQVKMQCKYRYIKHVF